MNTTKTQLRKRFLTQKYGSRAEAMKRTPLPPIAQYYAEWDNDSGAWGVFDNHEGKMHESYASMEEACSRADARNTEALRARFEATR